MTWTPSRMPSATPKSAPRIVLGVSGGIAAYKSVELLRLLMDEGFFVSPVLTPDATKFVGAVTFSALASEPARVNLYGDATTPIPHTYLGQNADLIVIAPATAHLIARLAAGISDDLLTATVWASRAPVLLCPAMHTEMWEQPSVQQNLEILRTRGVLVLEPDSGRLAGGDEGAGRLPDPHRIFELATAIVRGHRGPLTGKKVLISAGGTRESIDPVRVLSNRSSGKQGHSLAEVATRLGAEVTLVTTSSLELGLDVRARIRRIDVESAAEMREAMLRESVKADVVVMAAAVADFSVTARDEKIKKDQGLPELQLTETPDILQELVGDRRDGQVIVGFAAETTNVLVHAKAKLARKGVDLLVVNDVSAPNVGFEHSTNEVLILGPGDEERGVSLRSKEAISLEILTRVSELFK